MLRLPDANGLAIIELTSFGKLKLYWLPTAPPPPVMLGDGLWVEPLYPAEPTDVDSWKVYVGCVLPYTRN